MSKATDFYEIIDQLPEQAKTSVLYSLVGSLNVRIVGAAQRIVRACDRAGDDLHEEIVTQFEKTRAESAVLAQLGTGHDFFETTLGMVALREELRTMLAERVNQDIDSVLPFGDTMKFMTTSTRTLPEEELKALVEALNIDGLDASTIKMVHNAEQKRAQGELAAMSQRVLSVVYALEPEDTECAFDQLPPELRASLVDKMLTALNKARNDVVIGVLQRRSTANLGDIPMIQGAIVDAEWLKRCYIDYDPLVHMREAAQATFDATQSNDVAEPTAAPRKKRNVKVKLQDLQETYEQQQHAA